MVWWVGSVEEQMRLEPAVSASVGLCDRWLHDHFAVMKLLTASNV